MPKPKLPEDKKLLHLIRVRVSGEVFKRLSQMQSMSNCKSICELSRKILSGEKITLLHKNISMSGPMEELALIRKELKAIGNNINQQTHYFHVSENLQERLLYVNRTAVQYRSVDEKVERLLEIVNELAERWLQR